MVFTVIDIETTGLSKYYHQITEIAAAKVKGDRIIKTYQTLVNPKVKIPSFITKLTGIDNDLVKDAPTIDHVLPSFVDFLSDDIFVAHNATFDFGFLNQNLRIHHDINLENPRLCTRKLANRLLPNLTRKRLCDLCEEFRINNDNSHRALGDVKATVKIFNKMLGIMNNKGISKIEDIMKFEKSPLNRNSFK